MTIPTTPLDLSGIGYRFTLSDMQPFSPRAGIGYQDLLEDLRHYVVRRLVPYVNTLPTGLQGQLDAAVAAITAAVDAALAAEDERFAATLAEILAGANVPLNDATILAVLQAAGSTSLAYLDGRYAPLHSPLRLEGAGFDPTGATDSTVAINAALDTAVPGSTLVVPEGAVYAVSARLRVTKRVRLTGAGELRWTGGEEVMLSVETDDAHLDGLYLTNPSGAPISGISISASRVRVTANRLVGFRDGILVAPTGEYYDTIITANEVLDVIGSGTGPTNGDWSSGESNGDGIVSWGAATIIVGNRVTAKAGSDARIGIHTESLNDRETVPGYSPDSLTVVSGNIISGPFRRAITSEGVAHANITGNTIIGPTFWGINLVGLAHHSIVANNTIKWTSTNVVSGFIRTGILLYCIQEALTDVLISGNIIHAVPGSNLDFGVCVNFDASVAALAIKHSRIVGNSIEDESNTLATGIQISPASDDLEITDNRVYRFGTKGVYVNVGTRVDVSRNHLFGRGTAAGVIGISLEGGASEAIVDGNFVRDMETGIRAYFRGETLAIRGNVIRNGTNGVDLYGAVTGLAALLHANLLFTVSNPLVNAPTGVVLS